MCDFDSDILDILKAKFKIADEKLVKFKLINCKFVEVVS